MMETRASRFSTRDVRVRPIVRLAWTVAVLLAPAGIAPVLSPERTAVAQDEVRNYRKPILMVETGGHHARVRSLIWQDESTLLSGGEDKVVKVWDLKKAPRLTQSLRPPIWRGAAGTIYAMAATKAEQGQSYLAVGGYGVEARRGDLTIFRLPGLQRIPTGEIVARLLPPDDSRPREIGHRNSVLCLAFDRSGRFLASGGRDGQIFHQTLIIWQRDGETFRPRAALGEQERIGEIRTLAFSPNGPHLATGGADGVVRIWDFMQSLPVAAVPPQARSPVNTLAYSHDGRFLVAGHEDGRLMRLDLADLARIVPANLGTLPEQGPVESLACSADGKFLAVAIKHDRSESIDPMTMACDFEIRAMPAGNLLQRWTISGLIYATAFSPESRKVAYSAGPAQSIFVQDVNNLQHVPEQIRGKGSTPFEVGFSRDSQVVGLTRELFDPRRPPSVYEGFHFAQRSTRSISRDDLTFARRTYEGWSLVGDITRYVLELVGPDGRRIPLELNRDTERNWWSWTFIPPSEEHPRPTVAVGCESGVVLFDVQTGQRTRVFAGHSGPVVSLVPSPDGRWLASGALDQTVMVYRLKGCDTRPGLGASFRQRPDGSWEVAQVQPRGFAAGMGLLPGDAIVQAGIDRRGREKTEFKTNEDLAKFVVTVDSLVPHLDVIAVQTRRIIPFPPPIGIREVSMPLTGSTKRNGAALTLMLGADREWVVWTPQGYYDASIEGDARYLGWHTNADYRTPRPTDFVPIGAFSKSMMQPELIKTLWEKGDPDVSPPQPDPKVAHSPIDITTKQSPPKIIFAAVEQGIRLPAPGVIWLTTIPNPQLTLDIQAVSPSRIGARRVIFDEHLLKLDPIAEPKEQLSEKIQVQLVANRRTRLAVEAASEDGNWRIESIDMVYVPGPSEPPPPPAPKSKLVVLGLGVDEFQDRKLLPPIPFASNDAESLSQFLSDHLVSPDGVKAVQDAAKDREVLSSERASAETISSRLEKLGNWMRDGQLKPGDLVVLVVATHLLEINGTSAIAAVDTEGPRAAESRRLIPTRDISERLGELTDYGCRVVLFLDGVHEPAPAQFAGSMKQWVRDLQHQRKVITFVASREGPSGAYVPQKHGLFALGVTKAFDQVVARGKGQDEAWTLEEFGTAVRQAVQELSSRQQDAYHLVPFAGVSADTPFARP